jgi:hypothetical protein
MTLLSHTFAYIATPVLRYWNGGFTPTFVTNVFDGFLQLFATIVFKKMNVHKTVRREYYGVQIEVPTSLRHTTPR